MKKWIALILVALLALSGLTTALADVDRETVKKVQQALNDAGYDCGTPDGIAGKKTAAAITQYQTDNGLEATGVVDDALLGALGLTDETLTAGQTVEEAAVEEVVEHEAEAVEEAVEEAESGQEQVSINKPEAFADTFNGVLYNYINKTLGEQYIVIAQPYFVTPMYDEDVRDDGTVTQEFMGGSVAMMIQGTKLGDGQYGPLQAVTYTFQGKETEELDLSDSLALIFFMAVANEAMGGSTDDSDALSELLIAGDDETTFPTSDWEPVLYQCDKYEVQYEYINEGTEDYEQEIKIKFIASEAQAPEAQTSEEQAQAYLDIPTNLAEATGAFPDTFDALSDKYDIEGLRTLKTAWKADGKAVLTALLDGGSCEVPTYGYTWEETQLYKTTDKGAYPAQIDVEAAGDAVRLTLGETLPEDGDDAEKAYIKYVLDLDTKEGDNQTPYVLIQALKDLKNPSAEIETTGLMRYSLGNIGEYEDVRVLFSFGHESDYVRLFATQGDMLHMWTGYYDESGNLTDKEYSERKVG